MRCEPRWLSLLLIGTCIACSREIGADPGSAPELAVAQLVAGAPAAPLAGENPVPASNALREAAAPLTPSAPPMLSSVLYSEDDAEVGARVPGVVRSIHVELGDRVKAGQLLAVLQDEAETARVESAEAALELARLEHERATRLGEQSMITRAEVDQSAYRLRAAQAALREANVRLEYTRIRAPFDGVVSRRHIRSGQSVEERTPLLRVTALRPLRVLIRVPEPDFHGIAPGHLIRLHGLGGEEVAGRVNRIAPAVDPSSGTVEMLLDVPDPGGLRPGSSVVAELPPRAAARP